VGANFGEIDDAQTALHCSAAISIYPAGRDSLEKDFMTVRSLSRLFRGVGCCLAFFLVAITARASTVYVGALSYDTFVPAGDGSPGIGEFDLANLTGAFDLPPDFPVADDLTFQGAVLTLTFSDLSTQVFNLGDIGPGL
jgi:hypothetical protein